MKGGHRDFVPGAARRLPQGWTDDTEARVAFEVSQHQFVECRRYYDVRLHVRNLWLISLDGCRTSAIPRDGARGSGGSWLKSSLLLENLCRSRVAGAECIGEHLKRDRRFAPAINDRWR